MVNWNDWRNALEGEWVWIGSVFLVVFGALLLDFVQKRLLRRLKRGLAATPNLWDDAVLEAVRAPLSLLIWLLGLTFAADIVAQRAEATVFDLIRPVREVGVIAAVAWALIRFINNVEANVIERRDAMGRPVDRTTADAVAKLLRVSVLITAGLVVLQTLGFSVSGVLAFGGIGGLAVGLAAKDLLANFFGGLMVYLDRPFSVGDWVRSPDRDIEGTVEKIGWRLTCIRTFDKRPLYVPNATFTSIAVENPSRMSHRRIYETIGIRYDDAAKMGGIVAAVKQMLLEHPDIDQQQTLIVNFNSFAPSSLDFFVYTFTRTTNWVRYHDVKQDVLLRIYAIIAEHGAEVAFPTSTIHVPEGVAFRGGDGSEQGAPARA
ncbi:MAG: mechanosensitive ion channel protein MscS [Gammaproteobacteria bacterium SG8_47]|nr:MAG: mechanosensitive ion channel protein MscS [Gammaproteobacteria bacterium SG8_47]